MSKNPSAADSADLLSRRKKYLIPALKQLYCNPPEFVRGQGQYLYDREGRQYLDMYAGIATVSLGHCHAQVLSAMTEQMQKLQHSSTILMTKTVVDLAERLAGITPGDLSMCYFMNSGSEATELAVMMARAVTGRWKIIALKHSYHGQSSLWMPPEYAMRVSQNKLGPGIVLAENFYCYRCPFEKTADSCQLECAKSIEDLIRANGKEELPAAIIFEPIQGYGGALTAPSAYFEKLAEIARKYSTLLICDEVQTGLGRTGKMFGTEHYNFQPDIMTLGKALGNGQPLSACISRPEIASKMNRFLISTFGGNSVSSAAGLAVIECIEQQGLVQNAEVMGSYLMEKLNELKNTFPILADIRGKGLMIGIEIARGNEKTPLVQTTQEIVESCKDSGVVIGRGGWLQNVLRIKPALIINKSDADRFLEVLSSVLRQMPGTNA